MFAPSPPEVIIRHNMAAKAAVKIQTPEVTADTARE
jgi:hypothetical protein